MHPQIPWKIQMWVQNENNGRKGSHMLFSLQHLGGKRGMLEFWDGSYDEW
jgi:3-mercaptopyruvate sulfurtransferase SseA